MQTLEKLKRYKKYVDLALDLELAVPELRAQAVLVALDPQEAVQP